METVQVFCMYCKRPIIPLEQNDYHEKCRKLVERYNNNIKIKIKKVNDRVIQYKSNIDWDKYRIIFYKIILALGGINAVVIIIYQSLIGF